MSEQENVRRSKLTRVLVVEDERRVRRRVANVLMERGAEVFEADTVAAALAQLHPPPDLVVVDVRLPDGSGTTVVESCALLEPRPQILAISAVASAREGFELARLGVEAFLPKPFGIAELESRLDELSSRGTLQPLEIEDVSRETSAMLRARVDAFAADRGLSSTQKDLVVLLLSGVPRADFAETLGVTENTCKTRIRRILQRCDADRLSDIPRMLLLRDAPLTSSRRSE